MSRPKPNVLLEKVDRASYKADQILASEGIWSVFYQDNPINLKSHNILTNYPGPKYKKVSFCNPGHAINLAKKLNKQFQTDQFTVVVLDKGKQIYP